MRAPDPYEAVLDELVGAIELRECGDHDGRDWSLESRIRRLEQALLEQHRWRPSRGAPGVHTNVDHHGVLVSARS